MNKLVMMLVALMVTLFAANALAYDPPAPPAKGWYVVDTSGKMTASQIQKLNLKIEQVSKTTKNEFGILLLSDMGGDNIEDVANATYKKWGVGKRGLDNGCLIVVALKEHKSRIETGKGVEGEVTDLQSNDILKKHLNPHLRSGDFYGGFDETLSALSSLIESRHAQKADPAPAPLPASNPTTSQPTTSTSTSPRTSGGCAVAAPGSSGSDSFWPMVFIFGSIGLGAWLLVRRSKRKAEEAAEAERKIERDRLMRITLANKQREAEEAFRLRREREKSLQVTTPVVAVPSVPPRSTIPPTTRPAVPRPTPKKQDSVPPVAKKPESIPPSVAAASAVAATASAQALQDKIRRDREARDDREAEERKAEARRRHERDEEDRRRRERAERDEEDRRRRQREEDDARSSSSSSSSSFDWGSSSSDSSDDSDSGSGFGGGDSGGGGSSSDW